jgi:hypothetical protein
MRIITQKIPSDFGQVWISQSIAASKPDHMRNITGLFERQTTAQRRRNAYKASASRMAMKFAASLLTNGKA